MSSPSTPSDAGQTTDIEHVVLDIGGMHCAGCAARLERGLAEVAGVAAARVNLLTNQASVGFDPQQTNVGQLTDAVARIGFAASAPPPDDEPAANDWWPRQQAETAAWRRRWWAGLALLLPLATLAHGGENLVGVWSPWWLLVFAAPLQIYVGWPYFASAWRLLRHGAFNMDSLIALGTGTAFTAGVVQLSQSAGHHGASMYLADAGMILTFVTLGKFLEGKAKGRASEAIRRLLDLTPLEAVVVRASGTQRTPVRAVMVGETILVPPGERVPLDAQVLSGVSSVDQAWLTGEPTPVDKRPGEEILAGAINGPGALTAKVTRAAGKTALAGVIELVRHAQESKTKAGRLADRVVAWFVPAVLAVAALTVAAWGLAAGDWGMAVSSAVAVLVVACPCALGLATPAAVLVGSGRAAQMGILIKEARALEIAGRLTTVVLDKTGTVSLGQPAVVAVAGAAGADAAQALSMAAAVERLSRHPMAQTIVAEAESRGLPFSMAEGLEVVPGQGVRAVLAGQAVLVGNRQLLDAAGIDSAEAEPAGAAARRQGQTLLLVAVDRRLLGWIVLADPIAPASREAVDMLHAAGLEVHLLSGDSRAAVEAVAAALGIHHATAEALPEEKLRLVQSLQQAGQVVAMVGDGINDGPALAAADLGIAIGSGSDVAIEAADIVLVGNDLRKAAQAIALSRATLRTIRQNLVWAFAYNACLLPLAAGLFTPIAGVRLPPSLAAAAMAASSVSVVTNSLLLRRRRL